MLDPRSIKYKLFKGTTTVGIVCDDGVVMATDRRVTSGFYISHKHGKKIHKIDDHVGVTIAGVVAEAQFLVDQLASEAMLYKLENHKPIPLKSVASLASSLLFSARPFIMVVQLIIGGVDGEGPAIYEIDWYGSTTKEDKFIATGSGSPYALGVLEAEYSRKMTLDAAIHLAVKAVYSAIQRDPGSGEGIDVAYVSKEKGYRELGDKEVENIILKIRSRGS
ncbi:MAG: proteasome endopeptidase complex, archaeal, beta subunit [Thermoprotei archaeon]|nr:MAG: proteasome endopeptidase complex, archaeal, beta subunit [Thermoprotei archaeon]RLE96992.1 MAG: proteasome endopeptidase complex, archaeal, beta subunit [Thermoprotei archaeon]